MQSRSFGSSNQANMHNEVVSSNFDLPLYHMVRFIYYHKKYLLFAISYRTSDCSSTFKGTIRVLERFECFSDGSVPFMVSSIEHYRK